MPVVRYKEAPFPASEVCSLSAPHQTRHSTRNVRHEIPVGSRFAMSCVFGSHSFTRDIVSRAPKSRTGLQQVHKAQYGCFDLREWYPTWWFLYFLDWLQSFSLIGQWPVYIYVWFLFRIGALGKSLNGENRNDIVNTLDRAGAKATFFLSKLPYYNLLSRVIHRSHFRRQQKYVWIYPWPVHILNQILTHLGDCIYNTDAVNRVKYAYNHGHQVASHTWAHKDLTTLTWDQSTYTPFRFRFRD